MSQTSATLRNGHAEDTGGSAALGVASRGLRTMRHLANYTIAHSLDLLRNRLGVREGNASLRAISETRKLIVDGQKIGYEKDVIDTECDTAHLDCALKAEEAELTARLEAVRERRGG